MSGGEMGIEGLYRVEGKGRPGKNCCFICVERTADAKWRSKEG